MLLRALILALLAIPAFGQAFVATNVVTRLPLPWGGVYTNQTVLRLRQPIQAANLAVAGPSVPMLHASPVKNLLMRWQSSHDTNTVFHVFKSTNLTTWTPFTNLPYHATALVVQTPWDAKGFFIVGSSNGATGLRFK